MINIQIKKHEIQGGYGDTGKYGYSGSEIPGLKLTQGALPSRATRILSRSFHFFPSSSLSPNQIPSPTLISSSFPSRFDLVISFGAYISSLISVTMGRTVDQEVHAAFVEFRAKEDDKVRDCVFRNISNPPQQTGVTNIRDPFRSFLA